MFTGKNIVPLSTTYGFWSRFKKILIDGHVGQSPGHLVFFFLNPTKPIMADRNVDGDKEWRRYSSKKETGLVLFRRRHPFENEKWKEGKMNKTSFFCPFSIPHFSVDLLFFIFIFVAPSRHWSAWRNMKLFGPSCYQHARCDRNVNIPAPAHVFDLIFPFFDGQSIEMSPRLKWWHFDWRVGIGSGFVKPRWRRPLVPFFQFRWFLPWVLIRLGVVITMAFVCVFPKLKNDGFVTASPPPLLLVFVV
jgi:hypothetical protein